MARHAVAHAYRASTDAGLIAARGDRLVASTFDLGILVVHRAEDLVRVPGAVAISAESSAAKDTATLSPDDDPWTVWALRRASGKIERYELAR